MLSKEEWNVVGVGVASKNKLQLQQTSTVLLALFFIFTYLIPTNYRLLWQPDETRYAEISREMLHNDDWINPYLLNVRYFEKPVAGYWLNNISQILFGHTNFAVRFGSVFSTMISGWLIYWLSIIIWNDKNIALIAALIYISMFLVFAIGTYNVLDPIFTMWLNACMFCCYCLLKTISCKYTSLSKRTIKILTWAVITGFTCGMAFMTKGFLALILPVASMLPYLFFF